MSADPNADAIEVVAKAPPSGIFDSVMAKLVIASIDSSEERPIGDTRSAQRTFALCIIPALIEPPLNKKKWILLDADGRWVRYVGPMQSQDDLRQAIKDGRLSDSVAILGDQILLMWARDPEERKARRKRSPESIERTRAASRAAWVRRKAKP